MLLNGEYGRLTLLITKLKNKHTTINFDFKISTTTKKKISSFDTKEQMTQVQQRNKTKLSSRKI